MQRQSLHSKHAQRQAHLMEKTSSSRGCGAQFASPRVSNASLSWKQTISLRMRQSLKYGKFRCRKHYNILVFCAHYIVVSFEYYRMGGTSTLDMDHNVVHFYANWY